MRKASLTLAVLTLCTFAVSLASGSARPGRDGTVTSADGAPIRYHVEGKGEPALVFIHCWTCDRHLWDAQVTALAPSHRVVTLDLAGHGASGRSRKDWTMAAFGEDVKAVVEAVRLKQVILVGHSMGGNVMLEAARRMPERVVAMIAVDTLQDVERKSSPEEIAGFIQQFEADYKGATTRFVNKYLFAPGTPEAVKQRVLSQAASAPPEIAIGVLRHSMEYDPVPALSEIKAPLRAINGESYPTNVEANRRHAPGYEVVLMTGTGHYPMLEDPPRFNRLLEQVLARLGPGRR